MKNLALAKLQDLTLAKTLPHAWLLVGENNSHKLDLATQFSKWLLCLDKKQDLACEKCKSCILFNANTHADFCLVTPTEDKTTISIEDVRSLIDFTLGKPQFSSYKVVILSPAEAMPKQAANALLKSLEEPMGHTIYFLLAKHKNLLLNTIVSRCQILNINTPNLPIATDIVDTIIKDLCAAIVTKSSTINQIVEGWIKQSTPQVLYWLELLVSDLIRFKYTQDVGLLQYSSNEHMKLCNVTDVNALWAVWHKLQQAQYWYGNNYKPNLQLILENALLEL